MKPKTPHSSDVQLNPLIPADAIYAKSEKTPLIGYSMIGLKGDELAVLTFLYMRASFNPAEAKVAGEKISTWGFRRIGRELGIGSTKLDKINDMLQSAGLMRIKKTPGRVNQYMFNDIPENRDTWALYTRIVALERDRVGIKKRVGAGGRPKKDAAKIA